MSTQGMKTWKLGLFFVVSLMLVAGLFVEDTSAQYATVTVRTIKGVTILPAKPAKGDSGEVLDGVRVEYKIKTAIPGTQDQTPDNAGDPDEPITNQVTINLPSGWSAGVGGSFGSLIEITAGQTLDKSKHG